MPESEGSRRRSQRLSRALPCGRWIFLFFLFSVSFVTVGVGVWCQGRCRNTRRPQKVRLTAFSILPLLATPFAPPAPAGGGYGVLWRVTPGS